MLVCGCLQFVICLLREYEFLFGSLSDNICLSIVSGVLRSQVKNDFANDWRNHEDAIQIWRIENEEQTHASCLEQDWYWYRKHLKEIDNFHIIKFAPNSFCIKCIVLVYSSHFIEVFNFIKWKFHCIHLRISYPHNFTITNQIEAVCFQSSQNVCCSLILGRIEKKNKNQTKKNS